MSRIDYFDPNNQQASWSHEVIFRDSPLSIKHAVAVRKADHAADNQNAFVFAANSVEEANNILIFLDYVKYQGITSAKQLKLPIPSSFRQQGYVDFDGKFNTDFIAAVKGSPQIEILLKRDNNHHAVWLMNQRGAAYIDSKGNSCPDRLVVGNKEYSFKETLKNHWLNFYDVSHKGANFINDRIHFHRNIIQQQPNQNHESIDWCLTNMAALTENENVNIASNQMPTQKRDRQTLVGKINNGRCDIDAPVTEYKDTNQAQSVEWLKRQRQQWRRQQLKEAEQAQAEEQQELLKAWQDAAKAKQSTGDEQPLAALEAKHPNVELLIKLPSPKYVSNEQDINKFSTERECNTAEGKLRHEFTLPSANEIAVKSSGGKASYRQRIKLLAQDISQMITRQQIAAFSKDTPLVISSVKCGGSYSSEMAELLRSELKRLLRLNDNSVVIDVESATADDDDNAAFRAGPLGGR